MKKIKYIFIPNINKDLTNAHRLPVHTFFDFKFCKQYAVVNNNPLVAENVVKMHFSISDLFFTKIKSFIYINSYNIKLYFPFELCPMLVVVTSLLLNKYICLFSEN